MINKVKARAYGRVNLIGEHTDYNEGWVLPTAIPQYTEVTVEKDIGDVVNIQSSGSRRHTFILGKETPTQTWVDYLLGATKLLREGGAKLSGFNASIDSTIPEGSGVSSSAALEMSFLRALRDLFELKLTEVDLAKLGQRIENEFVGARVGIMDQMATGLAESGEALFLDTKTLHYERIPLPLEEMDLLVLNSGISHRLSAEDGGYNQRRAECEEACRLLEISSLRHISLEDLKTKNLPPVLMKRARHVVSENYRVHEAVKALRAKDLKALGRLFNESHASMRDDYEVSIPEIDLLVELCLKSPHVYGARLTGGGFGGSIVAIVKKGMKPKITEDIISSYQKATGEKATELV